MDFLLVVYFRVHSLLELLHRKKDLIYNIHNIPLKKSRVHSYREVIVAT